MDTKNLELRYNLMQQAVQLAAKEENLSEGNIIKKFRFLVDLLNGKYEIEVKSENTKK